MDNQSFDDLGFHPEGGFTFDDLYSKSNEEPNKENPADEKVDAEKARMQKEAYGDLPSAEDLFGISKSEEKTEEPKVEEVKEEVVTEPVEETVAEEAEPEEVIEPEPEITEEVPAPTYTEPVTINYIEEPIVEGTEPETSVDEDFFGASTEDDEPEEDEEELEEVEGDEDFEDVGETEEVPNEPAIDKILPDAYPINNNPEETVESVPSFEEPTFDIFTPHTEESDFDGLDEFSRSLLMGAKPVDLSSGPRVEEGVPTTVTSEEPVMAEPMPSAPVEEPVAPEPMVEEPSFDLPEEEDTVSDEVEEPIEESEVDSFEAPEEPTTVVNSIDDIDTSDIPITIANPIIEEEPTLPDVEEEANEEPAEVVAEEETSSTFPVVSLEGLHKDNVKKLNKAFAEFKEDMLRKDMETIFYGANEIMSKEAILYTYMGNEYTEAQEKAIADIDGYRFLNDVYEKSVEIRHDSEEKGEKQEFPETISLALANVVDTNEYLYNIRNGAEF